MGIGHGFLRFFEKAGQLGIAKSLGFSLLPYPSIDIVDTFWDIHFVLHGSANEGRPNQIPAPFGLE